MPTGRTPAELAAEYAARNGATLASCDCAAGTTEAVVETRVAVGMLLLVPGDHEATAVARATAGTPVSVASRIASGPRILPASSS